MLLSAPVMFIRLSVLNVKLVRYRGLSVHRQRDLGSVRFKSKKTRFRP